MTNTSTNKQHVVIVGGGFGGVFTALELEAIADVTLINQKDHFLFTPLLYEYLSREVEAWHIAPEYSEILKSGVKFIKGEVAEVDLEKKELHLIAGKEKLSYDILVLAIGSVSNFYGIEGAQEHAFEFRKLEDADALRNKLIDTLDAIPPDAAPQDARQMATFVVVGGGASGVELSTKLSDLLHDAFRRRGLRGEPRILLIEMSDKVVPTMADEIRRIVEESLTKSRVEVHTLTSVKHLSAGTIDIEHLGQISTLEVVGVIWTAGVKMPSLIERLGLEKDKRNLIIVEPTLQAIGQREVFAIGDIALCPGVSPQLSGTAQLAVQQSSLVAQNIRALIDGKSLDSKHYVELGEAVSLGMESAALSIGDATYSGALARRTRFAMYTSRLPTWQHRL
ncbi:MAG: NAD(P)/FAD-dependent oxidoreductase, partial [Pyrinomonadaceae bacterium]